MFFRFQNQLIKCPFITQLKYCQQLDFAADPNNKFTSFLKGLFFSISKLIKFPCLTQLEYCQKLDFEASALILN